MDDDAFKVGDLVRLKSGGPRMTVTHVAENVAVMWFEFEHGQMQTDQLRPECLVRFPEPNVIENCTFANVPAPCDNPYCSHRGPPHWHTPAPCEHRAKPTGYCSICNATTTTYA